MPSDRKKASRFPNTRWSLVGRAASSDVLTRHQALAELLAVYLPGLKTFLVEARRIPADLAEDLVNGFVADKVLAAGLIRHADQGRGQFRNFVLKSLNNFVTTKLRGEYAARAMLAGFQQAANGAAAATIGADRFDQEWVHQVVHDALHMMKVDCTRRGRMDMWEMFRARIVDPMLHDAAPVDYEDIVRQLGIATPRQAMNLLANAKRAFMGHLRASIGKYARNDQIDDELDDLREIVGR